MDTGHKRSLEREPTPKRIRPNKEDARQSDRLLLGAVGEVADSMSRYSVDLSPHSFLLLQEIAPSSTDAEIAEMLSRTVVLTDPNLENNIDGFPKKPTPQGVAQTTALAVAKTRAVMGETTSAKAKKRLKEFEDTLFDKLLGVVTSMVRSKKGLAAVATLGLALTACRAKTPQGSIAEPPAAQVENFETPTAETLSTLTPTVAENGGADFKPSEVENASHIAFGGWFNLSGDTSQYSHFVRENAENLKIMGNIVENDYLAFKDTHGEYTGDVGFVFWQDGEQSGFTLIFAEDQNGDYGFIEEGRTGLFGVEVKGYVSFDKHGNVIERFAGIREEGVIDPKIGEPMVVKVFKIEDGHVYWVLGVEEPVDLGEVATLENRDIRAMTNLVPEASTAPEVFAQHQDDLIDHGYPISFKAGAWVISYQKEDKLLVEVARMGLEGIVLITVEGEEVSLPVESFVPTRLNGDTEFLLTIKEEGEVRFFYLVESGEWVTPIEVQKNPDDPENYTQIEIEDVWSGRLLYSEMLVAEDFPEETFVSAGYMLSTISQRGGGKGRAELSSYIDGDQGDYYKYVKEHNDPRKWLGFYRTQTEDGEEMIIAAQRMLNPDGRSTLFLHYGFSDYWITAKSIEGGSQLVKLLFTSNEFRVVPVVVVSNMTCDELAATKTGIEPTVCSLYESSQNDPESAFPQNVLSDTIEAIDNEEQYWGTAVDQEAVDKLQTMILGHSYWRVEPAYFQPQS